MDAREHVDWLLPHLRAGTAPPLEEIEVRVGPALPATAWRQGMAAFTASASPIREVDVTVKDDTHALVCFTGRDGQVWTMDISCEESSGRIISPALLRKGRPIPGLAVQVLATAEADEALRASVHRLFDATYQQADHEYLDKQLGLLDRLAVALVDDNLIGFGLGDAKALDLPGLPRQLTVFGGLCCVAPDYRGHRLMGQLENAAVGDKLTGPFDGPVLQAGRMAHPLSMRVFAGYPSVVPKPGVTPTLWQQEVGAVVAQAYGVHRFDPETFVCVGRGRPIGYPNVHIAEDDPGWAVFAPVNRDRGDALLGLIWSPAAPEGW